MMRLTLFAAAAFALVAETPIAAQGNDGASWAESGWRASTPEEEKLREVFEDAQDDWNSRRDGEAERYECVMRWATWSVITRGETTDIIPAISGELMHSYADAQMSHHLSTLVAAEGGDAEAAGAKLGLAAQRFAQRPNESLEDILKSLGKCYVQPLSWQIASGLAFSGPELYNMLGEQSDTNALPIFVRSSKARGQFDRFIMDKDFVAAANLGARLHGANDKTTIMWNEVLRASLLSVEQGRGTELSEPLLRTLSQVWWPRYRRSWAQHLLHKKLGLPPVDSGRNSSLQRDMDREPGWVTQERRWQRNGQLNYVPCNQWNRTGC